ncbi:MAG: spore germination protein GerW family protein [Polyangiaceae bacterium]
MSDEITKIVNNLLDGVHGISKSETIIGEPQKAGEAMVIPVHRLKVAFGAGSAKAGAHRGASGADSGGQGAGGAVELDPVAAIAIGKDGHAHLLTVDSDAGSLWSNLLSEVPDLVGKLAHTLSSRVNWELAHRGVKGELENGETQEAAQLPKKKDE